MGSSFLPSEILIAFLYAQLESLQEIQHKRIKIWERYQSGLNTVIEYGYELPYLPPFTTNNAHLFYLLCPSLEKRTELIDHLNRNDIKAVFHYQPLHNSKYYKEHYTQIIELPNAERFGDTLVRLPLYSSLTSNEQEYIIDKVLEYVKK